MKTSIKRDKSKVNRVSSCRVGDLERRGKALERTIKRLENRNDNLEKLKIRRMKEEASANRKRKENLRIGMRMIKKHYKHLKD